MRYTSICVFALVLATQINAVLGAGDGPASQNETVYYDYIDDNGNLNGGKLELPLDMPLWAIKSTDPELRGASGNRVDIVVVGDGYTAAQQGTFHAHAGSAMATFFNQ